MYLSTASSLEITTYASKERREEQEDVSNRQDNSLSKADIQRQEKKNDREKSMIDECISRNLGDKI
jgi:hypothetical protein